MGTNDRREREKQQRHCDILNAAREIFFSKGFHATTMDDIAKSAELARGTLYLYFSNKEDVYALVLEEGLDILQDLVLKNYSTSSDPLTNLLNSHDAFIEFHDAYPNYYKVVQITETDSAERISPELRERLDEKFNRMVNWIAHLLKEGIEQDIFRPMPVREAAIMQIGLSMGYAQMIDKSCHCDVMSVDRSTLRQIQHDLIANGVLKRPR